MKLKIPFFSLCFLFSLAGAQAEMQPGDPFPAFSVQDQHEVAYTLEPDVRFVIVSFDMSSGKATNKYLEKQGAEFLPANKAVFLSNIYGMPWVGRKFALPKMKKYPHRILLADSETLLDDFPQQEDRVTVLELDNDQKIVSINFWDPESGQNPLSK